jgi:hypothetical protein
MRFNAIQDGRWRPKLGDSGWEVEWCVEMPTYPDDPTTCDPDNAKYRSRYFRTREEADAFAREVYPQCVLGSVAITPFVIEPESDEWPFGAIREYTADSDYYEGDD